MNKEQFNNMEIKEQINYINKCIIEQQKSLTKICNDIGINRSTITKRFAKVGFVFDKRVNLYQLADTTETIVTASNDTIDINTLLNRIEILEAKVNKLENNNNSTVVQQNNNSIRFYKNDTIVRAYRVDEEVYRRFKTFTDDNKQFKISDIISTALENFLNNIEK